MPEMHKCAECGLLAVRRVYAHTLEETPREFREKGEYPQMAGEFSHFPVCIEQQRSIESDTFDAHGTFSMLPIRLVQVLNEDFPCDEFRKWREGSTPQEHRAMVDRERLLKSQHDREDSEQKWRAVQEEERRTWETAERQRERDWEAEQNTARDKASALLLKDLSEQATGMALRAAVIGAVLAGVFVLAAALISLA